MSCFLLIGAAVVLPLYAILETRMIVRLVRLLRHPGRIAQFGLAANHVTGLCYWPGIMLLMLLLMLLTVLDAPRGSSLETGADPLVLMTFGRIGVAFAMISWVAMTLWFRSIVNRDLAIYREPTALVPVVILALICVTYLLGIAWLFAGAILQAGWLPTGEPGMDLIFLTASLLLLYVPAAPLAGFVLLIVHVGQVRAAKTWETYVPPEQEEMP